VHTYALPGSYVVSLVVHNKLGCTDSVQEFLDQTGVTASTIVSLPACSDSMGTALAVASGGTAPYSYSWQTIPPQTTQLAVGLLAGTYTVTVTDSAGCSSNTSTWMFAPSQVNVSIGTSSPTICLGSNALLIANATGGYSNYSYSWSPGAMTSDSVTVSPTTTIRYHLIVKDQNGCPAKDSVLLTVSPAPILHFVADTAGCKPFCPSFSNSSSGGSSYLWTFGDGDSTFQTSPTHCYNKAGQYGITLTGKNTTGCVLKLTLNKYIHVYPPPVAAFSAPISVSVFDPKVCFENNSAGGLNPAWHFGDAKSSTSTDENPCFKYAAAGSYCIKLVVENDKGCADSTVHCLSVKPDPVLYVPNTFSPNNDGLNDLFLPKGENIDPARFQIWVFDRWGNIVWQTTEWGKGWDGILPGGTEVVQQDTYVWKIECWDLESNFISEAGRITVVK
jgi:gliding motility-associated-like protein